ncbi:MAG TPA: alcohol dehydrogenase catalytic domain-containing protein [Thermoanaerobaculia bacterium]|jgi:L-iditol 2-dehydrogenase|nr:alcohol dehydrogenase catalytic domain-containing protein [Thermoanaerobaculia bacterium]
MDTDSILQLRFTPNMSPEIQTTAPLEAAAMTVAACTGDGGTVRIESRPRPAPGPGEMLLRLRCAGLCGTDLFKLGNGTAAAGAVLGHEIVGTVAALGVGVQGFAPGDRVAVPHHAACGECALCRRGNEPLCPAFRENLLVPGGFSEWVLVRERAVRQTVFGLPPHLADEAAVFLEPAACVLRGIRQARLAETARAGPAPGCAAILGGGGMGLLHLLVLKAVHPDLRVAVSDPLEERLALARRLGADAAAAPGEATRNAVAELSGGLGADAVFDTVGGAGPLEAALAVSRPGGAVVLFAHAVPEDHGERAGFDLNAFFKAERRLLASYSSSLADQREAYRLLVSRRLDPSLLVTHRLPLSRFQEAVALARERRALKVLLVPDLISDGEAG